MLAYPRIGLTVKSELPKKDEAVEHILEILSHAGAEIFLDPERTHALACARKHKTLNEKSDIDLLLVVGGDGTILRAIRELKNLNTPILSVNRGAVGFLAETHLEEVDIVLPPLLQGKGVIEARYMLKVHVRPSHALNPHLNPLPSKGEDVMEYLVLNEAVIAQGAIARLLDLKTKINGEPLTTFHADGLIIATPTGSTAYSLAAGGPIVHPGIQAMLLTPLNAHSFAQKPIVIPGDQTVEVEILKKENKFLDTEVSLTLDGQAYHTLKRHDTVCVSVSDKTVKFLRRTKDTFYETLRKKLKWGERV